MFPPKILGLNGYGLQVPDLAVARGFFEQLGLEAETSGDAVVLRSPGRSNDEVILLQGALKRLHHVSFYIDPETEDAFFTHLVQSGFQPRRNAPEGSVRSGIWFRDPVGTWIHLAPEIPSGRREDRKFASNDHDARNRIDVAAWRELDPDRAPLRLGHLLIFTPDVPKAEAFFCDVLGMRVSDRAVGKVSFLAAGAGVIDHHCFGLIASSHRGFQHASFQVCSMDDVGFGVARLRNAGFADAFGPGRHALASNLFHYVRDPWGSWIEFYADMDKISDAWEAKDWEALPYIWGPGWSPEFWGGEMNANLEPR